MKIVLRKDLKIPKKEMIKNMKEIIGYKTIYVATFIKATGYDCSYDLCDHEQITEEDFKRQYCYGFDCTDCRIKVMKEIVNQNKNNKKTNVR